MNFVWTNPRVKLMRLKKSQLQAKCEAQGIEYEPTEKKRDLVNKLCSPKDAKLETNALFGALGAGPIHPEVEE
jgi:hypothetical protein